MADRLYRWILLMVFSESIMYNTSQKKQIIQVTRFLKGDIVRQPE